MSADMDFCYVCDKDTAWNVDHCTGCHREWGHETPPTSCTICPKGAK